MRLVITQETEFVFPEGKPFRAAALSLKLQPGDFDGQRILEWAIESEEAAKLADPFVNGYGDKIHTLTLAGPAEKLALRARGSVETRDLAGVLKGWRERARPAVFLRETKLTKPDEAIRALADSVAEPSASGLDVAHQIKAALRERLIHEEGETHDRRRTAAEALGDGKGDLRDFSHLMVSTARVRGLPARCVLGYRLSEEEVSEPHIWAEIHVDGIGWIGFDAANDLSPTDSYVRLCSGLDAGDADPLRFFFRGGEGAPGITTRISVRKVEGADAPKPPLGQSQFQGIGGQSQRQG